MSRPPKKAAAVLSLLLSSSLLSILAGQTPAIAADEQIQVSVTAGDSNHSIFRWELKPGVKQVASVAITNKSPHPGSVDAFRANTITLADGGLSVAAMGTPAVGATNWIKFSTQQIRLAANGMRTLDFSVTVPPGTSPGDYGAAIAAQNLPTAGEGGGGAQLKQVNLIAAPILISVPGPRTPALTVGAATAEQSNVSVAVTNSGNQNLRPSMSISLRDDGGDVIASVNGRQLGFFLAGSPSSVTLPVESQLAPGQYYVDLTLTADELPQPVVAKDIPLLIPGDAAAPGSPLQTQVGGVPLWVLAAVLVAIVVIAFLVVYRRNRRDPVAAAAGSAEPGLQVFDASPVPAPAAESRSVTALELTTILGTDVVDFRGAPGVRVAGIVPDSPGRPGYLSVLTCAPPAAATAVVETKSSVVIVSAGVLAAIYALDVERESLPVIIEVANVPAALHRLRTELAL